MATLQLRPVLVTPPYGELVSSAEIKQHCHVELDDTDHDGVLDTYVQAAIDDLDGYTGKLGRCMLNQTWRVDLCDWPAGRVLRLPFPDVSAIASITYRDDSDVEQTVSASLYELGEEAAGSFVRFRDGFTKPSVYDDRLDAISVEFVAGFGASASDVPADLRVAVMMAAAHRFNYREAVADAALHEVPLGVRSVIAKYRRNII